MSFVFHVNHKNPRWRAVLENCISEIRKLAEHADISVKLSDILRSLDQNAKQWPMLRDIAAVVPLTINDVPQRASEEDWKSVLSAAFVEEVRFAECPCNPGSGRKVALGVSTSGFTRREFSEYIEFLYAFGTERKVQWSEKARDHYERYGVRRAA